MLKRKDKGILDQFLPAIIVIVLLAVLWTGSMISASTIDRSTDIQQVARTYLLKMETDGYLTEENRNLLLSDLAALDMEQIDLTGTTITDVGYGNRIDLDIRGVVNLKDMDYTAPMVNRMKFEKSSIYKNYKGNACNLRLSALEDKRFDFVRDEDSFKKIISKLEKYAE